MALYKNAETTRALTNAKIHLKLKAYDHVQAESECLLREKVDEIKSKIVSKLKAASVAIVREPKSKNKAALC